MTTSKLSTLSDVSVCMCQLKDSLCRLIDLLSVVFCSCKSCPRVLQQNLPTVHHVVVASKRLAVCSHTHTQGDKSWFGERFFAANASLVSRICYWSVLAKRFANHRSSKRAGVASGHKLVADSSAQIRKANRVNSRCSLDWIDC